jgi:hypothetical protein
LRGGGGGARAMAEKQKLEERNGAPSSHETFPIAIAQASCEQESLENSIRRRMCSMLTTEGVVQILRKKKLERECSRPDHESVFFIVFVVGIAMVLEGRKT